MKTLSVVFILVMTVSCGMDRQRDWEMDLIEAVLETASRGKPIHLLDESDPNWCRTMDEYICTLDHLVAYQMHGNPRYKSPELRDIFKPDEFDFITNQFKRRISFIDLNFTSDIQLVSQKELDNKSEFEKSFFPYFSVSAPAFSENKEYALIYVSEFCGIECGGGDLMIYKREKGKWERILIVGIWLS
ncbi:hypothetical protein MM213_15130 [Belliella sp. R4-6]|uniref:Uncharacterized protein n=1 Tax=Belliella alkalica TaxID=1730871 RepID=A0ABS9VEG7_9BACT|nr:hypothetical protein [Belliella alkalica]MCH7414832.1 hypothetical protein [Belliella alkalica]